MGLSKAAAGVTRLRGNDCNWYHHPFFFDENSVLCLNITFTTILCLALSSQSDAGRLLNCQPAIEHSSLSFVSRLFQEAQSFMQIGNQFSLLTTLSALSLSAPLTRSSSGYIIALAKGLNRDHSAPNSPIAHTSRQLYVKARIFLQRKILNKITLTHLSYLALGFLAAFLWRSNRIHPGVSDFCPTGALNIQELLRTCKIVNLRFVCALLITPISSGHKNIPQNIIDYFSTSLKIDSIVMMDPSDHIYSSKHRPVNDRMAEAETATLGDHEIEAERKAKLRKLSEVPVSSDLAGHSAARKVPWAHDPRTYASSAWSPPGNKPKRCEEAESIGAFNRNLNVTSFSSNKTTRTQLPTRDLGSGCSTQESVKLPSLSGSFMSVIRKSKSSIFRQAPTHEDNDIPPVPNEGFASWATRDIFRRNVISREHVPVTTNRSISSPERLSNGGVTVIRDLGMENAARAMGFTLEPNRFGFKEQIVGVAPPRTTSMEASSTARTMVSPPNFDDEASRKDYKSTGFEDDSPQAVLKPQVFSTPPSLPKLPDLETQGGLDNLEDCRFDNLAWLRNAFSTPNIDLLKDFGPPPSAEAQSPHSYSTFKMPDEDTCSDLHDLDTSSMIVDFDTNGAEQVQSSGTGLSPTEHFSHEIEVTHLRREIQNLVDKYFAKDAELQIAKAREVAAVNRAKKLEKKLTIYGISFESAKENFDSDNVFTSAINDRGAHETSDEKSLSSTSKGSFAGNSTGKRPSCKKPKSQERSFLKSLIGTTEPSLLAFEKLQEQSLLDANTNINDPDLASKLRVSPRRLPPEAPKPASKEPVPKSKGGSSSILKRLSSIDNLMRNDTKASGPTELKNCMSQNTSLSSQYSSSKDASIISIIEESSRELKPEGAASGLSQRKEKVTSFFDGPAASADRLRPSGSGDPLAGEHDMDSAFTPAALDIKKSEPYEHGTLQQEQVGMNVSRAEKPEEYGFHREEGVYNSTPEPRAVAEASFGFSTGVLAYEDHASLSAGHINQVLRSNPPSRSPPPCPKDPSHSEDHEDILGDRVTSETPKSFNPNKPLPEPYADNEEQEESNKDKKKRNFKNLFTRK